MMKIRLRKNNREFFFVILLIPQTVSSTTLDIQMNLICCNRWQIALCLSLSSACQLVGRNKLRIHSGHHYFACAVDMHVLDIHSWTPLLRLRFMFIFTNKFTPSMNCVFQMKYLRLYWVFFPRNRLSVLRIFCDTEYSNHFSATNQCRHHSIFLSHECKERLKFPRMINIMSQRRCFHRIVSNWRHADYNRLTLKSLENRLYFLPRNPTMFCIVHFSDILNQNQRDIEQKTID